MERAGSCFSETSRAMKASRACTAAWYGRGELTWEAAQRAGKAAHPVRQHTAKNRRAREGAGNMTDLLNRPLAKVGQLPSGSYAVIDFTWPFSTCTMNMVRDAHWSASSESGPV